MTRVTVLGCGLIGATIVEDLAGDSSFEIAAVDVSTGNLDKLKPVPNVTGIQRDLRDSRSIRELCAGADLVVGALPGRLGFSALRTVIECGKPYVDISFMAEDFLNLDGLARERGATCVVDCGLAPGLANMLVGHCHARLDRTERVEYCVGGLPKERYWPYQYRATFSPADVLEEYTRPVRMIEHGKLVVKPALSDPELLDFPGVGTLEAFNTDGLRSLLKTVRAENMRERTLRYPGHRELMQVLEATGFFHEQEIDVGGARVVPRAVTANLLFPHWQRKQEEEDFTVLRLIVQGIKDNARIRYRYDLYDEYDRRSGRTAMARTTAFPCAVVVRMVADGTIRWPGITPPEKIGAAPQLLARVIDSLAERGVVLRHEQEIMES